MKYFLIQAFCALQIALSATIMIAAAWGIMQ
jgi:hypothetical protein